MFENTPFPGNQTNPLNPPMANPGQVPGGSLPPSPPLPSSMPQPSVHTMPERFQSSGGGNSGGSSGGKSSTKKLVIILVVVIVVAGLGVGGLFVFQRINKNANANANTNSNVIVNNNVNTANVNELANENTDLTNLNQNTNTSANTNETNLNTDTGNTNTAANTNTSTNANVDTNTSTNTNSSTNTNTSTIGTPLPSSADTDNDGLTDIEEVVYGTDTAKPDSDGDTFIDGKQVRSDNSVIGEVYNAFNPAGTGKLEGSTLVKRQANASQEYNLLMPAQWTAVTDASGGILITPSQLTGETIQLRINDNPSSLSTKDWYKSISPLSNTDSLTVISVNGLEVLYTEDLSTIYFFKNTKVYSLQYQTGTLSQVNFRTTVDMMVRSFTLGPAI